MKAARLFFPLCVGFLISTIVVFFFGSSGLREYNGLLQTREALHLNLQDLRQTHLELNQALRKLTTDPETVRMAAHELGYYQQGEHRLIVEGYPQVNNQYSIGTIVEARDQKMRRDVILRLVGYIVPFCIYVVAAIGRVDRLRKRHAPGQQ